MRPAGVAVETGLCGSCGHSDIPAHIIEFAAGGRIVKYCHVGGCPCEGYVATFGDRRSTLDERERADRLPPTACVPVPAEPPPYEPPPCEPPPADDRYLIRCTDGGGWHALALGLLFAAALTFAAGFRW